MIVSRKIGLVDLDVNICEANELYFTESFSKKIIEQGISGVLNAIYLENRKEHMPLSVFFELTNGCNFNCPFCYINEKDVNHVFLPRWSILKEEIDALINWGMLYCVLSGGECTMHPDFKQIYKYLKRRGVLVTIFSNGYLIDDELINLFTEYKPFKIEISLYGNNDISYRLATNTINIDSERVYKAVLDMKNNGINVVCKTPINSLTEVSWIDNKKWCERHSIPFYYGYEMMDTYSGKSTEEFAPSIALKNKLREIDDLDFKNSKEKYELSHKTKAYKRIFDCSAGKTDLFISSFNKLYPCMKAINISEWEFDISKKGIHKAYREYLEKMTCIKGKIILGCGGCIHHEVCQECFFSHYAEKESLVKIRSEYCKKLKEFCNYSVIGS